jgi:(p)ppGpp synthase/HD superfamily hydrolase
MTYDIAFKIAEMAHKDQFDKAGKAYINHPLTVAKKMETENEKIVAILHDVCEDSNITIEDLKKRGFNSEIIEALTLITKSKNENYDSYIEKIKSNSLALKVKIADLEHNSDITRISNVTPKDIERTKKYLKILNELR